MREIDVIDLIARFDQHRALLRGDGRKVRQQTIEITPRKGRQKPIVQGEADY